jgi:3-phosphoinositide dependent protein kinase-1
MAAPRKLSPEDFAFGALLGEGAYARVFHARKRYPNNKLGATDYAIKVMDKRLIKRENKVRAPPRLRRVASSSASRLAHSPHRRSR